MCFSSRSGYSPFITPPLTYEKTFRYHSVLNFIQVSFCFLLFLGLGSVIGLGFKARVRGSGSGSIT